jgi:DNA-binding response OmpR family regulator
MSVLFLSTDLVFSSRLAAAAGRQGIDLTAFSTVDGAIGRIATAPVALMILDLSLGGLRPADAVGRLREAQQNVPIVAYAPHVHEDRLAAARDAGCDEVHSRGAFDRQMDEILARYGLKD